MDIQYLYLTFHHHHVIRGNLPIRRSSGEVTIETIRRETVDVKWWLELSRRFANPWRRDGTFRGIQKIYQMIHLLSTSQTRRANFTRLESDKIQSPIAPIMITSMWLSPGLIGTSPQNPAFLEEELSNINSVAGRPITVEDINRQRRTPE